MTPLRCRARVVALICAVLTAVPSFAQSITQPKQGQGGSDGEGAAGTEARTDGGSLEHCATPMGALAVVEPQDEVLVALTRYNLRSPVGLIRMMIQQSNCFIVVERGLGMQNMMQERALGGRWPASREFQRWRRADGHRRLHPDARRGVLGEQRRWCGWRGRWTAGAQGGGCRRRRGWIEIQGSADQHARRRCAERCAGCGR